MDTESRSTYERPKRAKLIFNPASGAAKESPVMLIDVITQMQAWKLVPEVYLVEPLSDLSQVVRDALQRGIRLFVVCGGDGTIDAVAGALVGTRATLGIIPTGTQNNVALSLGIPADIAAAVAILRTGRRIKVDVGVAVCGETRRPFLEICSVGLLSALFPAADDIQHGNLARIGDFLSTLVSSPPAEIHLTLDDKQEIHTVGHVVLVSNMPYTGPHYRVASATSFADGLLDLLLFADLSKLALLGHAVQEVTMAGRDDPHIQRYRVRRVHIETLPAMPVIVDGVPLEERPLQIDVRRRALAVMAGDPAPEAV